jgi:putative phage head-tail adaptor
MINANKIKIVYNGKYTNKTMIQIDGLNYPIEIRETYEEIKHKLKEVVNVR